MRMLIACVTAFCLALVACGYESDVLSTTPSGNSTLGTGNGVDGNPTPAPAPPPQPGPVPGPGPTPLPNPPPPQSACKGMGVEECQLLTLVNAERVRSGLSALKEHAVCTQAAKEHATDMRTYNYLSDDGRSETWLQRMTRYNLVDGAVGETIGRMANADLMFNGWMGSSSHKANLLSNRYFSAGVGYDGGYWVMCFTSQIDP